MLNYTPFHEGVWASGDKTPLILNLTINDLSVQLHASAVLRIDKKVYCAQ
jgi:hypothetical protein